MLKCIIIQKLRTNDFLQFITDVLAEVLPYDPPQLFIQPYYNSLFAAKIDLVEFLKKNKSTAAIDELNVLITLANERDLDFKSICSLLDAYASYHPDSTLYEHTRNLLAPVVSFDWESDPENYRIEFPLITDLLHYWTSDVERLIGLKVLNLYDWQLHLVAMHDAFNTRCANNTLQGADLAAYQTLREKILAASNAFHEFYRFMKAHAIINKGKAPFDRVVGDLNVIIDQYSQLLHQRIKPAE